VIQSKSIHSLSTGVSLAALALAACAGGGAGTQPNKDRVLLVPEMTMIQIKPGAVGPARFYLTSGGVPIVGQVVTFAIVNDAGPPYDDPQGATLAAASAKTDASGLASVDVHAGAATMFKVSATAGVKQTMLTVVVALGTGTVKVAPYFAADSATADQTTEIEVHLVIDQSCADIQLAQEPADPDSAMKLSASGGPPARFDTVDTARMHAAVGRALSSHATAIAVGCVDIPGSSLVVKGTVQVWLPLHDYVPDPTGGTYTITTPIAFEPPLAAAATIGATWRDLGDCPLDPAQLLLDCTVDAMSPETADDRLDCIPNPAAGGEGALGDAFAARRGLPIVNGAGVATACRGAFDASGAPSLDAIAMGMFGSPTPALVVALPAVGDAAAHILDNVQLSSILKVDSAGRPDQYVVTHTLDTAGLGSSAVVKLAPLALPVSTAYTTAATRGGLLVIDKHGFSLRLGRVARAGFAASTLAPRLPAGFSPNAGGLVAALAALARSDASMTGCAAFDRVLCAAVGADAGCLATACPAGLLALTGKLDAAFDAADGTGLDFYLSGSAGMIDSRSDGKAHILGSVLGEVGDPTAIATWSVDLLTASGRTRVAATFSGTRQ
jgi:hypothetical protein